MSNKYINLAPPLTAEQIAANEKLQSELHQKIGSPFALRSPFDNELYRSSIVLRENTELLNRLREELKSLKPKSARAIEIRQICTRLCNECATAAVSLGRFDLAQFFDFTNYSHYENLAVALERNDDDWCIHSQYVRNGETLLPNYFRARDVFSPKHNQTVAVIKCNECGFTNIRPLTDDLRALSAKRAEVANIGENEATRRGINAAKIFGVK